MAGSPPLSSPRTTACLTGTPASLLDLVDEGACERIVARNGDVVYRFPELEGDKFDLLE